ncbi:MAG: hypothetical protein ACRDV6_05375 [Acidimicrobiales bacterium]
MAQPTFVPITEADQVRGARRLSVPGGWTADRPADLVGPARPTGIRHGTPGPDQGFAMRLARRFEDRLKLTDAEDLEDVVAGGALLASKRGGLLGRAPCVYDLDTAFAMFGFLVAAPPPDLVVERRKLFASVSRDYVAQRALVDAVPDEALLMAADQLTARLGEWPSLLLRSPSAKS